MKKSAILLAITFSMSAFGYSRFHTPHDDSISVPGGIVVGQIIEEIDPFNYGVDEDDKYLMYGLGIVDFGNGLYQTALLGYHCEEVDDGAYGALYCDKADFLKYTGESCELGYRPGEFWCQ